MVTAMITTTTRGVCMMEEIAVAAPAFLASISRAVQTDLTV